MRHINALLNNEQYTNLEILLKDASRRADFDSFPLSMEEIDELEEVLL